MACNPLIIEIANDAGELLASRFGNPGSISLKGAADDDGFVRDLVTEVDHLCEELVLDRIFSAFPNAVVLAEEGGVHTRQTESASQMDYVPEEIEDLWLVDPLDGTINFAHGIPLFCVSIARYRFGQPLEGVIHAPVLGETHTFSWPDHATFNGDVVLSSGCRRVEEGVVLIGGKIGFDSPVATRFRQWRRLGSAALSLAWVACGRIDAYVNYESLNPWDLGAGVPMIQCAGGLVSNNTSGSWNPVLHGTSGVIASGAQIHSDVLELCPR